MLLKSSQLQASLAAVLDAILVVLTLLAALVTHKILNYFDTGGIFATFDMFWHTSWLYLAVLPIWCLVLEWMGVYQRIFTPADANRRLRIVLASAVSLFATIALLYALRIYQVPRTILFLHAIYAAIAITIRASWIQPLLLRSETAPRVLLAATDGASALRLATALSQKDYQRVLVPVGILCDEPVPADFPFPRVGALDEAAEYIHHHTVDIVAILPDGMSHPQSMALFQLCQTEGIETWLMPGYLGTALCPPMLDEIESMPIILFSSTTHSMVALFFKRLFDIIGSLFLIILFSPLLLIIAILVKATSPGPLIFTQERSTLRGRTFPMHKFRTMVQGAEKMLDELQSQNESTGPTFKIQNDPRVTRVGRFLRRYSLDELPQLFNVLVGQMSLVGPRPPIPAEVEKYEPWQRRRLSMRSGCTCLWQIGGRNALSFDEWMTLDLQYIDTWSLWLDFKILAKTLSAMIRGTGY
jgi:exopolysaccharide biosynthesis polyprenyl glycosylphosphotransferase